jgi:hydroxyacylglutathione hydrolase
MKIEQFHDKGLAHLSYAILSEDKIALIDPGRNPQPYKEFAELHNAEITTVIETHPHADFISSHAEYAKSGAAIYTSRLSGAFYPHKGFDEGEVIILGKIKLKCLNTPGHSPDSICIIATDEAGNDYAVFTGDTLFIGDVGRPDLRESAGNTTSEKETLAKQLYHSLRDKIMHLGDGVIVYPAHGAGSLCGKAISSELESTIGQQKLENYALQKMSENEFVRILLENQPAVPKYFPFDVELNRKGAPDFRESLQKIQKVSTENELEDKIIIIDTRNHQSFKSGHLKGAINLQKGGKFETWLGSVVSPDEKFYLICSDESDYRDVAERCAKIGYEAGIKGVLIKSDFTGIQEAELEISTFSGNPSAYTIVDIREEGEVNQGKFFRNSINIPLSELRERVSEIPEDKPVVVHCAGGYRSAAGASIISSRSTQKVFDLGEEIRKFELLRS